MESADAPNVAVVEVRGVSKIHAFDGMRVTALADVDFTLNAGEIVALTGPSGSGKSTLLNLLGCLDRPSQGTIRLGGTDVSGLTREEQAWVRRHYLGFVFQSFQLLTHATALENAALPLHYAGLSRPDSERRAAELLERVGLGARVHHFPNQLSGGERQRVSIARALAGTPRLLLCDEPTGALDSKTGREIMHLLLGLHDERGTSMVIVTHDATVAAFAHRQVLLRDGRIVDREEPGNARGS